MHHLDEFGVGRLVAGFVESGDWKMMSIVCHWPGGLAALTRGGSLVDVAVGRRAWFAFCSRIDPAAVGPGGRLYMGAVQDLDFVVAVEDDARIGALGHHELHVDFYVLEGLLGDKALVLADLAVDHYASSRLADKESALVRIEHGVAGHIPIARRLVPDGEVVVRAEGRPVVVGCPGGLAE